MNNLIKSEIYRLRKSKFFTKTIIMTIIFGIISSRSNVRYVDVYGFGFFLKLNASEPLDVLHTAMGATPILMIIIISLISDLIVEKYNGGIIRQSIAYGYKRRDIYISNLIVINLCAILITIIFDFMCFILKVDISSLDLNACNILIKEFTIYLILICTSSSIYTCICLIVKSKVISVAIYIIFSIFFVVIFRELLMDNTISLMLMNIASNGSSNINILKYISVSIVFVLCSTIFGLDYISKVDIA